MNTTTAMGRPMELKEVYKGYNIVSEDGVIMAHAPKADTLFIVCMDDSKSSGRRTFDEKYNTVDEARAHIDWLWEKMEFIADLDDPTGLYCIFNNKLRAVASYADKAEAQQEAKRLNAALYASV